MLRVQFSNFRCFSDTGPIELRPITLLVGENSTGKTSFLAGTRYLMESLGRKGQNPFNRDPYHLGGFEQIAHYRGGRGGRAKKFSLTLHAPLRGTPGKTVPSPRTDWTSHCFDFGEGRPQPALDSYAFSSGGTSIALDLAGDTPQLSVKGLKGSVALQASERRLRVPSSLVRENNYYVRNIIDELYYLRGSTLGPNSLKGSRQPPDNAAVEELWNVYRSSSKYLSANVFASAPVRTQPLRVYTPSELTATAEGSHVPLELSRAKRTAPEEWAATRGALVNFGVRSGLFTDIDVRHLGRSHIDPFQIVVKIHGPPTNLVDVGYGVSQALPIIYQMQKSRQYGAYLLQQPEVHLHPRAQAELGTLFAQAVSETDKKPFVIVETHSDYIIDRIRIEMRNGTIRPEDVTIVFFQREQHQTVAVNLYFNKQCEIESAPEGFRSFFLEEHARLLGL